MARATDDHPEDRCDRCGGRNMKVWHVDNALWNRIAGDFSILCPICFAELAELSGMLPIWVLRNESDLPGELERLQAVVDKLPKCWRLNEAGALVQDVPVVIGMEVWVRNKQTIIRKRQVLAITSTSIGDGYHPHSAHADCYSTEAAARAAGEEGSDDGH